MFCNIKKSQKGQLCTLLSRKLALPVGKIKRYWESTAAQNATNRTVIVERLSKILGKIQGHK